MFTCSLDDKSKASPGKIFNSAEDTKSPSRGFLVANMIKYAEGCRFVHIYQKNPQGITSLLTQCGSNNTQYEELSSLIFVPNFSSSDSKIYYLIF